MGEDVAEDAQLYHKLWNENTGVDFEELEKESVSEPSNSIFLQYWRYVDISWRNYRLITWWIVNAKQITRNELVMLWPPVFAGISRGVKIYNGLHFC